MYEGNSGDICHSILQVADGGYVLGGAIGCDFGLMKTDANGNIQWSRTFGGGEDDWCTSIVQTTDNGYFLAGYTQSFGAGNGDFWLVKTNANGDSLWSRTYGGSGIDYCCSIQRTTDSGFVLSGWTSSFGAGNSDFWLVKIDANGDSLWSRTFGGTNRDDRSYVRQTSDGGYILAGSTWSFGSGNSDFWLVKTDENGNRLWSRSFGGSNEDWCNSLQQTADSGYILAGDTWSFGSGNDDFWIVKTGPALDIEGSLILQPLSFRLSSYPNPFNAVTTLEFSVPNKSLLTISVYDVLGREVGTIAHDVFAPGYHRAPWACPECPSGVYFMVMSGEGVQLTQKAMILR
jgi:hypothetical protein